MQFYKKAFIIFALLYVLFFVKSWGSVSGFVYSHDDVVYFAQTASLVNDFDIDIKNNLGPLYRNLYLALHPLTGKMMAYQPIGSSLLYIVPYALIKPFVLLTGALRGTGFDDHDPLFFVALCFFTLMLFYYSGILLVKTLERFFKNPTAQITAVFTLWGTILPVYVFRRPIFAVVPEFFLVSLLFYYIAILYTARKLLFRNTAVLAFIFAFVSITRWNDIYLLPFCLVVLAFLVRRNSPGSSGLRLLRSVSAHSLLFLGISCALFLVTQVSAWQSIYRNIGNFVNFYTETHVAYLQLANNSSAGSLFAASLKGLFHIFLGTDWGVLFTMPVLFLGIIPFVLNDRLTLASSRLLQRAFLASLFITPVYCVLLWKNTGDFYGYRFLVSLLPFAAFGVSFAADRFFTGRHKAFKVLICVFCVLNFFIILPFEFSDQVSLLPNTITPLGGRGWGNNHYVVNAVKFYFSSDAKELIALFSRGYAAFVVFGILSKSGFDLARFSPKVKSYFSFDNYRQYASFLYFILAGAWLFFLKRRDDPKKV